MFAHTSLPDGLYGITAESQYTIRSESINQALSKIQKTNVIVEAPLHDVSVMVFGVLDRSHSIPRVRVIMLYVPERWWMVFDLSCVFCFGLATVSVQDGCKFIVCWENMYRASITSS